MIPLTDEEKANKEKSARAALAIGAVICAVLAAIGWTIAIYAWRKTPTIHDVVMPDANGRQTTENKAGFLFVPAVMQTFMIIMLLNPLIRWKRSLQKISASVAPAELWTFKRGVTILGYFRAISIVITALNATMLYWLIERVKYLLG